MKTSIQDLSRLIHSAQSLWKEKEIVGIVRNVVEYYESCDEGWSSEAMLGHQRT